MEIHRRKPKKHDKTSADRPALPRLKLEQPIPDRPGTELHNLPMEGAVADYFRQQWLPLSRKDVSRVMRACIRREKDDEATLLVQALVARDGDSALTLHFGCPFPTDEQGPLTDKGLKFLARWIRRSAPRLSDGPIALDLSGNEFTAKGLKHLCTCLHETPQVVALDLSRNRFLVQPRPREKMTGKALCRKLTSPRKQKEPVSAGDAIGDLLTSGHLQRLWLNGNPFRKEDREHIIHAVVHSSSLCELGMSDCALSEENIKALVGLDGLRRWRHLALGAKLTEGAMDHIAILLTGSTTLEALDLGTTEPYSHLTLTGLFDALGKNHSLKLLSLAGHSLRGNGAVVRDVLRKNTCLRALNMSGSDISNELVEALVQALSRQGSSGSNETLTALTLPECDETELNRAKLSFAISRNRKGLFEQLQAHALACFNAGCPSAGTLPPELHDKILGYLGNDERALRNLASLTRKPPDATSTARARAWTKSQPTHLKSPP